MRCQRADVTFRRCMSGPSSEAGLIRRVSPRSLVDPPPDRGRAPRLAWFQARPARSGSATERGQYGRDERQIRRPRLERRSGHGDHAGAGRSTADLPDRRLIREQPTRSARQQCGVGAGRVGAGDGRGGRGVAGCEQPPAGSGLSWAVHRCISTYRRDMDRREHRPPYIDRCRWVRYAWRDRSRRVRPAAAGASRAGYGRCRSSASRGSSPTTWRSSLQGAHQSDTGADAPHAQGGEEAQICVCDFTTTFNLGQPVRSSRPPCQLKEDH